jgi:hypothetical protein
MTLKMVAVIASLSAAALAFPPTETFARGGVGGGGRGAAASFGRPGGPIAPRASFLNHRRGFVGSGFWPGSYYYGGAPYSEPLMDSSLPLSNDINYNYTYKQDVPWDWAHRYPPNVIPSDRPYVPGCSSEPVTVAARGGGEQTVNVIRCY